MPAVSVPANGSPAAAAAVSAPVAPSARKIRVAFFPWWKDNPYQVLLGRELTAAGFEVMENPPLSLREVLARRDGIDVVHLHWPHGLYLDEPWRFPLVLATLYAYKKLKNNLVWTVHELDFYETRFQLPDRIMRRFLLKSCRALFIHAQSSKEELERRFGVADKAVLSYHPSYEGHYADTVTREEARARLGIPERSKVFLFFGHVKPYKGVEDLIASFREIADPDARLLIAGKPRNRWIKYTIERLASRDSRIQSHLRFIPDDEVQVFFNASDAVVFPFRRTHTSGSIMLAATFGRPIIAPGIASIPEYVDDSMAVLFDPERPESLTDSLKKILTRDLAAMGHAAREHAKNFTWRAMATRQGEVYRRIVADFER